MKILTATASLLLALSFHPGEAAASAVPKPRPRPAPAAAQESPPPAPAPPAQWASADIASAKAACARMLKGLDISFSELEPVGAPGGCGAPAPVEVTAIAGVSLTPPATLTCDMAQALHGWITASVIPAAKARLGAEPASVRTATSYACRRRNNSSSGKMSEHALANALDMAGFTFTRKGKDTGVAVGGGNWGEGLAAAQGPSKEGSFMEAVRREACTYFTTVLGPGSDPYHGDHFHVDVRRRKGDYRICQ